MYKLINAGLYRLIKSKIFWCMIIATILMTVITYFIFKFDMFAFSSDKVVLENNYTSDLIFISFIIAIFITLFNGSEFSERYNKK